MIARHGFVIRKDQIQGFESETAVIGVLLEASSHEKIFYLVVSNCRFGHCKGRHNLPRLEKIRMVTNFAKGHQAVHDGHVIPGRQCPLSVSSAHELVVKLALSL